MLEVAQEDESVNGDGGLTLGWNSLQSNVIPAGTTIGGYVLMKPYAPTDQGNGSYRYDIKLSAPIALIGMKLFFKESLDSDGKTVTLYTFPYTGMVGTILEVLTGICGEGSCVIEGSVDTTMLISVAFDGDTVKSAAQKIADACGEPLWFTKDTIHIGCPNGTQFHTGEYYTRFVVLGGTKNMAKRIATSEGMEYAAVTQRLTLDPKADGVLPGSMLSNGGEPELPKLLIFDDIYPKVRMRVTGARSRLCWLLDNDGNMIPAGESDTAKAQFTDNKYYKTYAKWYVTLGNIAGEGEINLSDIESILIDGTVLRMQFLPYTEGGTSKLAGREFELVHFTVDTEEWQEDDVLDTEHRFVAHAGEFRIVMTADGSTILPAVDTIVPEVGDIVSLVNIAVPDSCYAVARERLLAEGLKAVQQYNGSPASFSETSFGGSYVLGGVKDGYVITNISTDLITGEQNVTYGTFSQKGVMSSIIDKVDGVSVGTGSGTKAEEQSNQKVYTMSEEQWQALARAGGNRGMVTVSKRLDKMGNELQQFGADIGSVQSQADQRMEMWFGSGVPHPVSMFDIQTGAPNNEWTTDAEKQQHVGDLYYNTNREASDQYGGRAWRWAAHETGVISIDTGQKEIMYWWDEVTDADTIMALEKVADVAYDGKLSGGSEKMRVYTDWTQVVEAYKKYTSLRDDYGIDITDYLNAAYHLAALLDGESQGQIDSTRCDSLLTGVSTPSWLSDLSTTTTILLSSDFITLLNHEFSWSLSTSDVSAASRDAYRKMWIEYYTQADALDKASKEVAQDAKQMVEDIADDGIISAGTEKSQLLQLWQETVAEFWKIIDMAEDHGMEQDEDNGNNRTTYHEYCYCYLSVALMLNGQTPMDTDFSSRFDASSAKFNRNGTIIVGTRMPDWIRTGNNGKYGEDIILSEQPVSTAVNYRSVWNSYYEARSSISKDIDTRTKSVADTAKTIADNALAVVQQITQDGQLTVDEIPTLRREFETLYRQREEMVKLATDNTTHHLIDTSLKGDMNGVLGHFHNLSAYLNMGVYWEESTKYDVENNGSSNDPAAATFEVVSKVPLKDNEFPAVLKGTQAVTFVDDWNAENPTPDQGKKLCRLWADVETAITKLTNDVATITKGIADKAEGDASNALAQLTEMASDGKLDPVEKIRVKNEFKSIWYEKDAGDMNLTQRRISAGIEDGEWTAYVNAFAALAKYLNGGETWPYATQWLSSSDRVDSTYPAWLQEANMGTTQDIDANNWRNLWMSFYNARTVVITALSKVAKDAADEALDRLNDIASDSMITESEKNDLLQQWRAWAVEYETLYTASRLETISASAEWSAYYRSFHNLGRFLDDPTVTLPSDNQDVVEIDITGIGSIADFVPEMLADSETYELTVEQKATYYAVLLAFRTARTALLAALSTGKLSYWVSENLPQDGFYVGDRCVWLNHKGDGTMELGTNTTMMCIKDYDTSYDEEDNWQPYWKEASLVMTEVEKDPRILLVALVERIYKSVSDSGSYPVTVIIGSSSSSVTTKSGNTVSNNEFEGLLYSLYTYIGTYTLRVYHAPLPSGVTFNKYDMLCTPVVFAIPNGYETLEGGVQISMYNGTSWEYLQESTSSLIESLGNKILAVVFGSNEAATEAAGLSVGQMFAKMFATAQVWDSTLNNGQGGYITLTEALFGLTIEKDTNGNYVSSALISADKINLTANKLISLLTGKANDLSKIGIVIRKDNNDETIELGTYDSNNVWQKGIRINGDSILMDADGINFKTGNFSIKGENGSETFGIGSDGKVRMQNATVQGNISASTLTLEKEAEIPNLIAQKTLSRDGQNMVYTRISGGQFEIGTYSEASGEYEYSARYDIGFAEKEVGGAMEVYPVIRFKDKNGLVIGQLDEDFFASKTAVADTWEIRKLVRCGNTDSTPSWSTYGSAAGTDKYKFTSGYTIQNGVRIYTSENDNGKWFEMQNISSSRLDGAYVECVTRYRYYRTPNGYYRQPYRDVYDVENGVMSDTPRKMYGDANIISGGDDIDLTQ